MVRVYVASPYGFSAATQGFYQELLDHLEEAGFAPTDPWKHHGTRRQLAAAKKLPLGEKRLDAFRAVNKRVGECNADKIGEADALLAILDGVDVDSGTAAEVGFAAALGKPIVGLRLDTRLAGDNEGATVNMQVEYFIGAHGGKIVHSIGRATALLSRLVHRTSASRVTSNRTRGVQ